MHSGQAVYRELFETIHSSGHMPLYWAYTRENRPCADLSHGWGSNSQWRTAFRRDYRIGSDFHFNVDGSDDLRRVQPGTLDRFGLNVEERIELLIHRCFVTTEKPNDDLSPYQSYYCMTRP